MVKKTKKKKRKNMSFFLDNHTFMIYNDNCKKQRTHNEPSYKGDCLILW